jgi:dihydrofolate reductase
MRVDRNSIKEVRMAKLLYSATVSLDGFMAGPGGDMGWLTELIGPNPVVDGLVERIGALLVGNRTYGGDDPYRGQEGKEGEPFGGGWSGPQFVLTHHARQSARPDITFVTDLGAAVTAATEAAGDKYVNVLGASVARQCLAAGVLDEVFVCVAPVLLGDGVRLFETPGGQRVRLERIHQSEAPLAANLWYRVLG